MFKTAHLLAFTLGFLLFSNVTSNVWAQDANFVKVSLESITTRAISELYISPPIGDVVLSGIPFYIPPTKNMVVPRGGGSTSSISANVPNVTKIFLLLNSYNTWHYYNNQKTGEIKLEFNDSSIHTKDIIVGGNIREWREGNDIIPTVNWVTDPNSQEVFRGLPTHLAPPAVMDMLAITLPLNFAGKTLIKVSIADTTVGDPGIIWMGLTVQQGSTDVPAPFLDLPWDYEGKGLSFTEAALAINSYFDHEYPLLSSGMIEPIGKQNSVIFFRGGGQNFDLDYSSHDGYDYGKQARVNLGDPVLAAADGCATYLKTGAGGNTIRIDHGNGYQTRYLHLQEDGLITKSATCVNLIQGQQIGKVGATGHVIPPGELGAHIHFMVIEDKNGDGDFDNNIPDGVTNPFGWQSQEADPWPNHSFNYAGQDRTGNTSFYLWTKAIANLSDQLTSNGGFFEIEHYKLNFPQGATNQNLNLEIQAQPTAKPSNLLHSIGSTIKVTATDLFGNIVDTFQNFFTVTVDFNSIDISSYDPSTLAIYSSEDGVNWTKEKTTINEKTASATFNHLSYFALMAQRLDTIAPTTTAVLTGNQGEANWFRSDVQVTP